MTGFILIVEDDENFISEIRQVLHDVSTTLEVKIAKSRDAAYDLLDNFFFDLIILDLKIPTIDGSLDANPQHGHAVFGRARAIAPGTPIFLLTGSPAEPFIPDLLQHQQHIDIWGEGKTVGTVNFLKKYDFSDCPVRLAPIINAIQGLADVELERREVDLSVPDDRLLRMFARRFGGTRCVVSLLGGGLSVAKVVRLRVTNKEGALIHNAVAKLGSLEVVRDEGNRFDNHVARLDASATPRKLTMLEYGARAQGGIFYGLAAGCEETAFDIAIEERASAAILSVEKLTKPWRDGVPETRRTICEIRRRLLSDESLTELQSRFPINWVREFEEREIQTRWTCIHGDLHGSNILASANGAAVIIDYGDVGHGPSSLDPVTLELSLLFHPHGPFRQSGSPYWPSLQQSDQWDVLDVYLRDCPAPKFITECRNWAHRVAAGKREITASAYSYLIRQLKYEDTNKDLALALLNGVKTSYETQT